MPMTASAIVGRRATSPARVDDHAQDVGRPGRRGRRWSTSTVVDARSRSRAAMRRSSRRFQVDEVAEARRGGSGARRVGRAASPAHPESRGEQLRQAAARRQHGDERLGRPASRSAARVAAGRSRARPHPSRIGRRARRGSSITAGAARAASRGPSQRSARPPRRRAAARTPRSRPRRRGTTPRARRGPPPCASATIASRSRERRRQGRRSRTDRAGSPGGTVVGGVADHRLRVDGEPRLALGGQHVGRVEVAVQQDLVRGRRAGRSRIVVERPADQARDRGRRRRRGAPRARRPTASSMSVRVGQPVGRRRARAAARRWPRRTARPRAGPPSSIEAVARPAALDQQRAPLGVVVEQAHGAVAVPTRAAPTRLGRRLGVRELELEHAPRARRRGAAPAPPRRCCRRARAAHRRSRSHSSATSATSAGSRRATPARVALPRDDGARRASRDRPGPPRRQPPRPTRFVTAEGATYA